MYLVMIKITLEIIIKTTFKAVFKKVKLLNS